MILMISTRKDVEGVPFLLDDIRASLLTFKEKNSAVFHKCYKEEEEKEEEEEEAEKRDFLCRLSHIANPYDPLLVLSLTHPNLFKIQRHGPRLRHTSIGNSSEKPGVVDPSSVREVLKHYLNSHNFQ